MTLDSSLLLRGVLTWTCDGFFFFFFLSQVSLSRLLFMCTCVYVCVNVGHVCAGDLGGQMMLMTPWSWS